MRCEVPLVSLNTFLVHIALSVFEVDGRQHPVSGMLAFRVIEHFDVVEDVLSGLLARLVCSPTDMFAFQQVKEALRQSICRHWSEDNGRARCHDNSRSGSLNVQCCAPRLSVISAHCPQIHRLRLRLHPLDPHVFKETTAQSWYILVWN